MIDSAITYLTDIHKKLDKQDLLDLHTFLYFKRYEKCPICNYNLAQNCDVLSKKSA